MDSFLKSDELDHFCVIKYFQIFRKNVLSAITTSSPGSGNQAAGKQAMQWKEGKLFKFSLISCQRWRKQNKKTRLDTSVFRAKCFDI